LEVFNSFKDIDFRNIGSLELAFLGDCVFELFIRENLVSLGKYKIKDLHRLSVEKVCCQNQEKFIKKILLKLNEEELEIYTKGRNSKIKHVPKSATQEQYRCATGLECLFGYLYLQGKIERLKEFFEEN